MQQGQKVQLINQYCDVPRITGTIAGMGHINRNGQMVPVYLIDLSEGFYNPEQNIYVQFLAVHRDNLEPIE